MHVRLTLLMWILSLVMTPFVSAPLAGSARAADTPNHRIQRSSATGTFLGAWGSQGTGDGQFDSPRGVAVAPDGTVYVADSRNSRIQRFSATGTFLGTWGSPGSGDGQFIEPEGIAVAPDRTVYTVDFDGRVQRFNATGTFLGAWEVESSGDVGVAPDGTVYVTESSWYRVRRFSATGAPLGGWGAPGYGDGQFNNPRGVAVAPDGTVYVVDSDLGHRIQRFSAAGTFLGTWGSPGSGDGQFLLPRGVAVAPDGTVYVADTGNHRIQVFSADGTFLGKWGSEGSGNGQFKYPEGVAVAPDGAVYVADTGNHRIQVFRVQSLGTSTPTPSSPTPTSSPLMPTPTQLPQPSIPPSYRAFQFAIGAQAPIGQFYDPRSVAVAPDGTVYVADTYNHRIQRFSASGAFLGTWGARGSGDGQFDRPHGVAVAPDGTVYVADTYNHRIQRFSADGTFLGKWGSEGSGDGRFIRPEGIAVAPNGTVYVVDSGNHRIQYFSATGAFLGTWGAEGRGNGRFYDPRGVAVAPDGTVYVADTFNDRVQRFRADGTFLSTWGAFGTGDGRFVRPIGIAVAPDGTVYVADGRIQRFRADGTFLGTWGGSGDGQFMHPKGTAVAVAPDGTVYVADSYNHLIQRFRADGTFLGTWGAPGEGDGEFYEPFGVAVGSNGAVYVADSLNHRIQVFSADGTFLSKWGSQGSGDGEFERPVDVAVAPDGTVYVADTDNHRIQVFGTDYPNTWRGEFFSNDWLAGPVLHVANVPDLFLNLSWSDRPAANVPADHFSSRWLRYVNFPTAGRYRFTIRADDGVRFWVDDRLVVDSWQPQLLPYEVTVELSAGSHRLLLEHWDRDGSATVALEWMTTPEAPSNLRQTRRATTSITLSWQDNSNNETGFHLDRWDDNASDWKQIATLGANVTSYTDTSVNCGQSNRYRVSAYNAAGWSAASEVTTTTERCPLILIPGIMGSYIHLRESELWPGVLNFARFAALRDLGPESVVVRDAIRTYTLKLPKLPFSPDIEVKKEEVYSPIIDFLKSDPDLRYVEYPDINNEHIPETTPLQRCQQAEQDGQKPTLFVFAYDWRQSNRESAKQLKEYIDCVLRIHKGSRVDIIAHSMGGLVARRYLIDQGHNHHVARLITIATPFYGAARAITAIKAGRFPGVANLLPGEPMFEYEMRAVAKTAVGAHELLPSTAYFEAYFEQNQCPFMFFEEYNELWETKYAYRCVPHDKFTGWINEKAAGSGDTAARFHAESQDDWRNDKDLLEFVPTYYHIVSTDRQTLGGVVDKRICTQLSPFGSFVPLYMCSNHIVDGFYDWGDGTVPSRSGEHARYRNPQAQVIKVSGEHTEMLSGEKLHDHLRRILLGSETGASQQGETARSGHVSVAGMLHPQATTFTLPPVASNEQTTFFNTALDTPPEHTRRETVAYAALPTPAASDTPPVADMHYLRAINVVSLTITDRTGRFPSAVTFDHLDDGVYAAVVPPDDVYTATITLKAREGAIIEMRTGTNDSIRRAVRYVDILPERRNRQVQVIFSQNGFSLLRQDRDADGLFETDIPPTAEISGDAANDREPPVIDVSVSGPLDARTVTITATDVSGVADIRYSFDGITFRSYTGSFVVDATQTPVVYTFADDRAANRSGLLTYSLSWKVYLPLTIR